MSMFYDGQSRLTGYRLCTAALIRWSGFHNEKVLSF